MKRGLVPLVLAAASAALCGCGSKHAKPAVPAKIANLTLQSKLLGKPVFDVLVTPAGGGKGRPLLVFLHGYGASPSDTLSLAFLKALRRLGDKAPVVFLPEGDVGWWHDDENGPWQQALPPAIRLGNFAAVPHAVWNFGPKSKVQSPDREKSSLP